MQPHLECPSFYMQGHVDAEKFFQLHNSSITSRYSVRLLVVTRVIWGYDLSGFDATQAYLQSLEDVARDAFI